jgi:hypothetical protein
MNGEAAEYQYILCRVSCYSQGVKMTGQNCAHCSFRARYDKNPGSILGRIWRWHISYCPGWSKYIKSLTDEERTAIAAKYKPAK